MTTDTRIESLETQVRTLRRLVFALCGLLLAGGLFAAIELERYIFGRSLECF